MSEGKTKTAIMALEKSLLKTIKHFSKKSLFVPLLFPCVIASLSLHYDHGCRHIATMLYSKKVRPHCATLQEIKHTTGPAWKLHFPPFVILLGFFFYFYVFGMIMKLRSQHKIWDLYSETKSSNLRPGNSQNLNKMGQETSLNTKMVSKPTTLPILQV